MAAFEIERIDPQEYTGSQTYVPVFTGNAVPAYQPKTQPIKAPERKESAAPRVKPRIKKHTFLSRLQVFMCTAAVLLVPYIPKTADAIFGQLGTDKTEFATVSEFGALEAGKPLGEAYTLFARIDEKKFLE
ncbi:MAG: hypothetical protein IKM51_04440, partial [Oscillospiraceae bacterium]|nr:hypothetical protein [Oscillospiraceae bacterium]